MSQAIDNIKDLLERLASACPSLGMFRGQVQDWPLLPSIGRHPAVALGYHNWRDFHDELMRQYARLGRPYISALALSETDLWIHAQHHGLPTRLLDWSTNPLKALFFAVNEPRSDGRDGVLWFASYSAWREELNKAHSAYWESELVPLFPDQSNPRLTQQESSFLSYPLPLGNGPLVPIEKLVETAGETLKLTKFTIPAEKKESLRRELSVLGIQYRLLFPDIEGVARGIRLEQLA